MAAGHQPVAVSRRPRPWLLGGQAVETRAADFADPASLAAACAGAEAVFLNLPSTSFQAAEPLAPLQKVLLIGFLMGALQLAAGLSGLGKITQFVSRSVIVGYTSVTIAGHGWNLLPVFFGQMVAMGWPGQFNLDFTIMGCCRFRGHHLKLIASVARTESG